MAEDPRVICGLGVDIVEIARMREALRRRPGLKERLFSADERAYCEARNKPEIHYAMRFAAKEAVLKALGTGFSGVRFRDVEVVRDERGRPRVRLGGNAAEMATSAGVSEVHLSLSFTRHTAVASAVAVTQDGEPRAEPARQASSRAQQVEASFKNMRSFLDYAGEADADLGSACS